MENFITEIPACHDSISTPEARILFMDLCEENIHQQRLTKEILECIKGYVFAVQISHIAEKELINTPDSLLWNELITTCGNRMLECSETLGLTPLDRKNLGLI